MNKTVRTIGLFALAAGALYFPVRMLVRKGLVRKLEAQAGDQMPEEGKSKMKSFAQAYRGTDSRAHNRNGHLAKR